MRFSFFIISFYETRVNFVKFTTKQKKKARRRPSTSLLFAFVIEIFRTLFFKSSISLQSHFRYKNLNNTVATRGKSLQAAVHSLQSFDKSLDQVSEEFLF